ncbi:REPS1 family protein [Megaselia abdita]
MEEVSLTELESRYFSDLFSYCDVEKTGKVPMSKAAELFETSNLSDDVIRQITSLSGIPETALHISRSQFYSCLKLIAAQQSGVPIRFELLASSISLPPPKFSWKEPLSPTPPQVSRKNSAASSIAASTISNTSSGTIVDANGVSDRSVSRDSTLRRGAYPRSPDLIELAAQLDSAVSDIQSTDSEVEHNETTITRRRRRGSPEAWSTNSDSPTPTNSVAERPWAKESLWQGLLGDEHRQLLGTEEESSDRHSSDEEGEEDALFQMTAEQKDYYFKQFIALQPNPKGLLSGHLARVFFEKSKIPTEELRIIWHLSDVTRDGSLSLEEFTAAMHLIVLRRHNIPIPSVLPLCLHPSVIMGEVREADLLHLNDDVDLDKTLVDTTPKGGNDGAIGDYKRPRPEKNIMNLSGSSQSSTKITPPPIPPSIKNRSVSNSPSSLPPIEPKTPPPRLKEVPKELNNQNREWTKFPESPCTICSPGPKPVNFDMKITSQAIVSDPQIFHPVPLRVTPVGAETSQVQDSEVSHSPRPPQHAAPPVPAPRDSISNSSNNNNNNSNHSSAIQRPQAKKLPQKSIGGIPPPPQREPSIGGTNGDVPDSVNNPSQIQVQPNVIPPLPPPRPHRHTRSSSLDLNKLKLTTGGGVGPKPTQNEMPSQTSFDVETTGFADFTKFSEEINENNSKPTTATPPRPTVSSIQSNQFVSAFEVYKKPTITPRSSQSPVELRNTTLPAAVASTSSSSLPQSQPPSVDYEKKVSAINESLKNLSVRGNKNISEILKHLREQNALLLRLCHDLSEELVTVQTKKEEIRMKLESTSASASLTSSSTAGGSSASVVNSVSGGITFVTANSTGGSGGSASMA